MSVEVLTDVLGVRRGEGRALCADQRLDPARAALADRPLHFVTDWGEGSVVGVQTVLGSGAAAVAALEKQLRERGETEEFSLVLVHEKAAQAGSSTLAFTAVPVKTWRLCQQMAQEQPNLMLVHDWTRTLLAWAKSRGWVDGPLVVVMPEGIDVLLFQRQRLCAMERFKSHGDLQAQSGLRLGQRVSAFVQAHRHEPTAGVDSPARQALEKTSLVLVCTGAEALLGPLLEGLAPWRAVEIWAEQPAALAGIAPMDAQRFVLADVLAQQRLQSVTNRALDKLGWLAERWIGRVGLTACVLTLALAGSTWLIQRQTQAAGGQMTQSVDRSREQLTQLQAAVNVSDQLSAEQTALRAWVQKRIVNAQVPDIPGLLERTRAALPSGIVIDEIGLVVEDGSHLVTLVGQTDAIANSLRVENGFVQALREQGFEVRQRDVLLRNGQPKFKLSLTWNQS